MSVSSRVPQHQLGHSCCSSSPALGGGLAIRADKLHDLNRVQPHHGRIDLITLSALRSGEMAVGGILPLVLTIVSSSIWTIASVSQ